MQERICVTCGYDLRATTSGSCPECGRRFDPGVVSRWERPGFRKGRWRWWSIALAIFSIGYPLVTMRSIYVCYFVGWFKLGHAPRMSLDDPKHIGIDPVYGVACLLLIGSPLAIGLTLLAMAGLIFATADRVYGGVMINDRSLMVILTPIVTWVGTFVILGIDPFHVLEWFMD